MSGVESAIFRLQGLCAKKFLSLKYDLEELNGRDKDFLCKLTIGEISFDGRGRGRTMAMQVAATKAVAHFISNNRNDVASSGSRMELQNEAQQSNYVGELHEITQKRLLPPPKFDFAFDAEKKLFLCTARLMQLSMSAHGRSKKLAKKNACKKILEELKIVEMDSSFDKCSLSEETHHQSVPEVACHQQQQGVKSLKHDIKLSLLQPTHVPAQSYSKMIDDLAQIHRFDVTHVNISEHTTEGLYQCLVQLSTYPVLVFHGHGATKDEAHTNALINAFVLLRILVNNNNYHIHNNI